jgi:flavorubredoxin
VKIEGVQVLPVVKGITCLRGVCTERLKYEIEYGLKRGTTDNSYLIERNGNTVLVDVPVQAYIESYGEQGVHPVQYCASMPQMHM